MRVLQPIQIRRRDVITASVKNKQYRTNHEKNKFKRIEIKSEQKRVK